MNKQANERTSERISYRKNKGANEQTIEYDRKNERATE